MNILIVDDIVEHQKLLGAILESEGHTVTQAANGIEAVAILESMGVDAVISDIFKPRMDGYRFCCEVRAQRKASSSAVHFLHRQLHFARAM